MTFVKFSFLSLILSIYSFDALGQESIGLVFVGDFRGEKLHGVDGRFDMYIGGHESEEYFVTYGSGSLEEIRERLTRMEFYFKKAHSKRFRKIDLKIPTNPKKYLIFRRDHSLEKGSYFLLEWSDEVPFKLMDFHTEEFRVDTTSLTYKQPHLEVNYQGNPLSTKAFVDDKPFPKKLILLEFVLTAPDSLGSKLFPKMEALEILFVDTANNWIERTVYLGDKRVITVFWPQRKMRVTKGYAIVFNLVYTYDENGEQKQKGLLSRRMTFQ